MITQERSPKTLEQEMPEFIGDSESDLEPSNESCDQAELDEDLPEEDVV